MTSKNNKGGRLFYSISEEHKSERSLSSFLEFDSIQGVHKWWEEQRDAFAYQWQEKDERNFSYVKVKHVNTLNLKEPSMTF